MCENQRIRISKRLLKESLIRLLHKKNIHKISVTEICNEAEINRSTFYKYYGSQFDLLQDMEKDIFTEIERSFSEGNDYFVDLGLKQLTNIITFIDDNLELCRILVNNNVDPRFPEKLIDIFRVRQALSQLLPEYSEEKLSYIFTFIVNGGYAIVKDWINKEHRESPQEIAVLITDLASKLFLKETL